MRSVASIAGIVGGAAWLSLAFVPPACVPATGASEVFCNRLWTPALGGMAVGALGFVSAVVRRYRRVSGGPWRSLRWA